MKTEELKVEITYELARKCRRLNRLTYWVNTLKTSLLIGLSIGFGTFITAALDGHIVMWVAACLVCLVPTILLDKYFTIEIQSPKLDEELDQAIRLARLKQDRDE